MTILPQTEWKDVVGYEGKYAVSGAGKIKSLDRKVTYSSRATHLHIGSELKPKVSHNGYLRVTLFDQGKPKSFFVHRIVAAAFIGQILPGQQVNHKNGDKSDNRACNLEYMTASQNRQHAFRTGLQKKVLGEKHAMAKLTTENVKAIKTLLKSKTAIEVSQIFGVSKSTIQDIKQRRTWIHVH